MYFLICTIYFLICMRYFLICMRYVANKKLEAKQADQLSLTWINDILRHNLSSVNAILTTRSLGKGPFDFALRAL